MNVMAKAWEIAKAAVVKFGGKVKEYFAQSLKMAWSIAKNETGAINVDPKVQELATKHNIPYVVARGFFQLAESIGTSVEKMQIRNWQGKRVYYRDQRRSSTQHRNGTFYYNLEDGYFVNSWYKEEKEFGRMEF